MYVDYCKKVKFEPLFQLWMQRDRMILISTLWKSTLVFYKWAWLNNVRGRDKIRAGLHVNTKSIADNREWDLNWHLMYTQKSTNPFFTQPVPALRAPNCNPLVLYCKKNSEHFSSVSDVIKSLLSSQVSTDSSLDQCSLIILLSGCLLFRSSL